MQHRTLFAAWLIALAMLCVGGLAVSAHDGHDHTLPPDLPAVDIGVAGIHAACAGGPVIDGITLDECVTRTFLVGGVNKNVRVWYTKNTTTASREEDGVTYTLRHWIDTDAQAQQVAAWFEDAWVRFFTDSGHHLYDNGCGNTLNVQMEDGIGWSGIAYWGGPGSCRIGIDSPDIRAGGGQWTVYHEAQHYLQYSYDAGCYGYLKPNYPADAEFVEGYADLGADSVNAALDLLGYQGSTYNPEASMYEKSYGNIFNKYFMEQLGTIGAVSDPWHHIDALYEHYQECNAQNTLYVLDSVIPALGGGSEKQFFLDFFAANWARTWADPTTQPELTYFDDDASPFGNLAPLRQDVSMAGGTQSWVETTPDDWAARYYQVRPQAGCPYVEMEVDGAAGAQLGINFMAAKTTAPTRVLRSAQIGEDYARTFAGAGVHDRLVAVVNSFGSLYDYTVRFTCVTPTVNILEPRQVKFAMVGEPASPIAFLTRWTVTGSSGSIRGLAQSSFAFDAEGAPATVVTGTFQEVGDEYWAVLLPPVKPAGTTFVDYRITLDGSFSDTETGALLYVAPGNSDMALSFDASGSMATEDTIGEGTRLDNAKKAGQVVADLLRIGDRFLVQDWSALDNPPGCGIDGGGSGNCPLDVRTLLPRTEASAANLVTLIDLARTQIANISAREWTPVGGGVRAAKNELVAGPANTNQKHIFLLSDGRENVNPLYSAVKAEIIGSGVVVHTIGLGPEAPGNLLAQIAADTGGVYRPVATSGAGSSRMAEGIDAAAAAATIAALDGTDGIAAALAAPFLPGQLGLANVYDYLDTEAEGGARIFNGNYLDVPQGEFKRLNVVVDGSVNQLRLVVPGKQPDDEGCTVSDIRGVEVLPPGADLEKGWIPISPKSTRIPPPATWEIRNHRFDDILIVPNPDKGSWSFRTRYAPTNCIPLAEPGLETVTPAAVNNGGPYAFSMNVSVHSDIQLDGRLLGLNAGQGHAGDAVTILGMLFDRHGLVKPTAMLMLVEGPAGQAPLQALFDDGAHEDGSAGDGIFGATFAQTTYGGGYSVRILASFKDPTNLAVTALREWNGGFWIDGPHPDENCGGPNDKDSDCMPDEWERRCKLNLEQDDRRADPDEDGLTNAQELQLGTLPCRADTDNGGENDGSEVRGQRNPLYAKDDKVRPLGRFNLRALNSRLLIDWTYPLSYTNMRLLVSTDPNAPGKVIDMGQGQDPKQPGSFLLEGLQNGMTYYVRLQGTDDPAEGGYSDPAPIMPKSDPDMPSGAFLIEDGAAESKTRNVMLNFSATDRPLDGAAQSSAAHMTDQISQQYNTVSGNIQMRVGNDADLAGAAWQPLVQELPWTLDCSIGELCRVYAQFRDGAENESLVVNDSILFTGSAIFLPVVQK